MLHLIAITEVRSFCRVPQTSILRLGLASLVRLARNPFNPQLLISHLTNSNGCDILLAKVADCVPVSSLLSPAARRVF